MLRSTWKAAAVAVLAFTATVQAAEPAWITESNANAQPMLELLARYAPEAAANLGVDGHDAEIRDLRPNVDQRFEADSRHVGEQLAAKLVAATDPRVKQDLQILIGAERVQRASSELTRKLMLPYFDVPNMLFGSFQALL